MFHVYYILFFGTELDFPKLRWKFLEYYFIIHRCVNFKLDAQMGESVLYGWNLFLIHVG